MLIFGKRRLYVRKGVAIFVFIKDSIGCVVVVRRFHPFFGYFSILIIRMALRGGSLKLLVDMSGPSDRARS